MYLNPGVIAHIMTLRPQGTNSTMFTECCGTAICDEQRACPRCDRLVIGHDEPDHHRRGRIRWLDATSDWKR